MPHLQAISQHVRDIMWFLWVPNDHLLQTPLTLERSGHLPLSSLRHHQQHLHTLMLVVPIGTTILAMVLALLPTPLLIYTSVTMGREALTVLLDCAGTWMKALEDTEQDVQLT